MGITDRLHDTVTATLGALEAPVGFVSDIVTAPFDDKTNGDVLSTVYHAFTNRGGQLIENTIGPEGIGGELIGALPEQGRQGITDLTGPTQSLMDAAYNELISQPLSTAVTAGSLADAPGGGGIGGLFRADTWAEAYNIAEHRSPGQSIALAFLTKDINNPAQLAKAQGTDAYNVVSGVTDAVARTVLDPTALALGGATAYRQGILALNSQAAVDHAVLSGKLGKFADDLEGLTPAEIRHIHFPEHAQGAIISDLLGTAGSAAERERLLRIMMGSTEEVAALRAERPELAGKIDRMLQRQENLRDMTNNGWALANTPDEIARLNTEIDALYSAQARLERTNEAVASLREVPRTTVGAAVRTRALRSDYWQDGFFAKPFRAIYDMRPHPWAVLDDPNSDIQLWRMLQDSKLPVEEQLAWRSRYLAAGSPGARANVLNAAEEAAVGSIADANGMTRAELGQVLSEARRGRALTKQVLDSRAYDGQGRSVISLNGDDGVTHLTILDAPIYETQLPNLAPVVDMDAVKAAAGDIGRFRARHPSTDIPIDLLNKFMSVWKPSVLLRVGFPIRNLTDEMARSMGKIGVLATIKGSFRGASDGAAKALEKVGIDVNRDLIGSQELKSRGYTLEGAFGAPGDGANINRKLIEARESFGTLVSAEEGNRLDELIRSGPWRSVQPPETAYPQSWEHAVNNQIGQSALGAHILEALITPSEKQVGQGAVLRTIDEVADETVKWLRSTDEGQRVMRALPVRKDLDAWVREVAIPQIEDYLPTDELKAAAWQGTATHDMLVEAVPNAANRPIVHGGVVDTAMGESPAWAAYRRWVDRLMNIFVAKPSDYLVRQPFFDHLYNAEVDRRMAILTGEARRPLSERMYRLATGRSSVEAGPGLELSAEDLAQVERGARRYALNETKALFDNFAEHSQAAHMLRFVAPFYGAWSQIFGAWAGVAMENPAFIRRLQIIWRAPERAGVVTDGAGNIIDENGRIRNPVANSQYKVGDAAADGQRNVTIRVPTWARDLPGMKEVGGVKFSKDSINMLLHGWPSVGPIVQVPMNEIAKARPDLESSMKWALPFGATQRTSEILLPGYIRRARVAAEEDENRSYANTVMRIWTDRMVDYNLGRRPDRPTWAAAEKDAKAFWHMRTVASFTLPVAPQFVSPYQPYIDAYRARRELDAKLTPEQRQSPDYRTPDEWFLDQYGQEFFPIVASMSKSMDGIPASVKGAKIHAQYADLLAQYPELGGLLVGAEGAGEFSRSVYEAQFARDIGPGNPTNERRSMTPDEFQTEASVRLGWIEFSRVMDGLDSIRIQRGLPSFSVKAAADLQRMKQAAVAYLANDPQYRGWYEDYINGDETRWDKRINGMTAFVADDRLTQRPEMQGLAQYLSARRDIVAALNARGSKSLSSKQNADLAAGFETYIGQLVDQNPAFAALYYRWLQNDPVVVSPITGLAEQGAY